MPFHSAKNMSERIRLVRSEYSEMPGLRLSRQQAERLWNLDSSSADVVLGTLEQAHFLRRTANDLYVRADLGCR
jgi:hypothetical protein